MGTTVMPAGASMGHFSTWGNLVLGGGFRHEPVWVEYNATENIRPLEEACQIGSTEMYSTSRTCYEAARA
jgi:hypothetical protein